MKIWNKFITLIMTVVLIFAMVPGKDTRADDTEFWKSMSNRYYYERLNPDEVALYNAIYEKCWTLLTTNESNMNLKIDTSSLGLNENEIYEVFNFFESDNPQFYFIKNGFSMYVSSRTGEINAITNYIYDDFANGSTRASMTAAFKSEIINGSTAIDKKSTSGRVADIEKAIHDYLASRLSYNINAVYNQSIISAIVYGSTVCAGYGKAYALFCHMKGINCVCVVSDSHMWNCVDLHGYWYAGDLTNDDGGSKPNYNLFNTTYNYLYSLSNSYRTISKKVYDIMPETRYDIADMTQIFDSPYFTVGDNLYFMVDTGYSGTILARKMNDGGSNPQYIEYYGEKIKVTNSPIPAPTSTGNAKDDIRAFVDRLYTEVLGRQAEEDGANYWTNRLYNFDISGAEVAAGFIFSKEFQDKNVSNSEFLDILYRAFFNREFDFDGKNYWETVLIKGAVSRQDVAYGFIYSREWANTCAQYGIISGGTTAPTVSIAPTADTNAFVERLYTTALGRDYDTEGRDYWAKRLANFDLTGEGAGVSFFLSPEFTNFNLSNDEFVERLYKTFMDRESDPDGKAYWISQLQSGRSRSDVVYGFTRSEEFKTRCINARIRPY